MQKIKNKILFAHRHGSFSACTSSLCLFFYCVFYLRKMTIIGSYTFCDGNKKDSKVRSSEGEKKGLLCMQENEKECFCFTLQIIQ